MHWPSRAYNNRRPNKQTNGWTGGRSDGWKEVERGGQTSSRTAARGIKFAGDGSGSSWQTWQLPTATLWQDINKANADRLKATRTPTPAAHTHTQTHICLVTYIQEDWPYMSCVWFGFSWGWAGGRGATEGSLTKIIKVKQCTNSFGLNDMRPYVCTPECGCVCVCKLAKFHLATWSNLGQLHATSLIDMVISKPIS